MTRARNVLVADRWTCPISSPIVVYGPTRKTSSRPITSGGSSRLASTPASHTRGKGSVPRASFQASGVPRSRSTASVTAPDSTETSSGSSPPGSVSALATAWPDRWVSRAMTGPSRAIQTTAAPATEAAPDTERRAGAPARIRPGGRGRPGGSSPVAPPAAAAGLAAQLTLDGARHTAAGGRRGQQREPALPVLGQARARQRVLDERDIGRAGLADRGDVDDLRRAGLGHVADDLHRGLGVGRRIRRAAQVDRGGQRDVVQVQFDGLGDE